jgi:cytoskeleton-associated protein 5
LYQNLGPGIEPWLTDLKPVQVKELKEGFEEMEKEGKGKGSLQAERLTRAQAREAEAGGGEVEGETGAPEEPEGEQPLFSYGCDGQSNFPSDLALPDPRTMAEPVDIVPKLPSSLKAGLTSSKWKERKEVLDELLALVNATPRIQDSSEFGELARSLATCIQKDANINCVIVAAGCMEGLAKGVMTPFGRYRESVVGPMLERLKERKVNVTDAIGVALDSVFSTVSLST